MLSAMGQNRQKLGNNYGNNYLLTPSARSGRMGPAMNESEKQFSFTRVALSTCGRARNQIPISHQQKESP
jgi:hypothetical protein